MKNESELFMNDAEATIDELRMAKSASLFLLQ